MHHKTNNKDCTLVLGLSEALQMLKTPMVLNELLAPLNEKARFVLSVIYNIRDLVTGNIEFSLKTGDQRKTFFWKNITVNNIFATAYNGDWEMDDPGRIAIKGSNYTTYPKPFKESYIEPLLGRLEALVGIKFFIMDLSGCVELRSCNVTSGFIKD